MKTISEPKPKPMPEAPDLPDPPPAEPEVPADAEFIAWLEELL